MPFEIMDQRGLASSNFYEEMRSPTERQNGFWRPNIALGQQGTGEMPKTESKLVASSPLEKAFAPCPVGWSELQQSTLPTEQMAKPRTGGGEISSFSKPAWASLDHQPKSWSNMSMQQASYSPNGKIGASGITSESSLFSSSLSDIFSRKLRLLRNDVLSPQPANPVVHYEEEPYETLEQIEAQTIGNLLPDEDDLFSGVIGEVGRKAHASRDDDTEDFDIFSSGGGMELEGNNNISSGLRMLNVGGVSDVRGGANGSGVGKHPSRTLIVQNIYSNVEDSELKTLFEQFGDIRALYTACKHRGFVMISYYDVRAAQNAMRALQSKPLRLGKLDLHYSVPKDNQPEDDINEGTLVVLMLDSSVRNDELHQVFSVYGEIKEIRETKQKTGRKFIEFYDARAAEAAISGFGRNEIAGNRIKLDISHQAAARRFMQQSEQEQDELSLSQSPFRNFSSAQMVPASSSMDGGSFQVLHNSIHSPVQSFIEHHRSSSIPIDLASSARLMSVGKPIDFQEPTYSLDEMKFENQSMPNLHPHSFPEYQDPSANGSPYKTSRNYIEMAGNGPKMNGPNSRCIQGAGSNGHHMVFGSSGNGSTLHGNHQMWSNSNLHQQHPSSALHWPRSPSVVSGIHAHRLPPVAAFPRAPPVMMNSSSPVHHHIGSAPAMNSPFWDRRLAYGAESPESSSFHLGSHGSMGFPGSSPTHLMEIASHNVYGHVNGNRMDMTATNAGLCSPQQMSHLFPGRNQMISMPSSFDSQNERVRNLSHRRNESNSNNADKKLYELDIERILHGDDRRTTLMIKNIPNKYTSKMLLSAIDEHCKGSYDFIYLPIDFKNKCNVGYAFINMVDPYKIVPFYKAFNGKKWEKFNSEKVASLAYARIQGKSALIAHFQNSSLMNEDKRCRPILFHTDGPNAGDQEPFPMGSNPRTRPGKLRNSSNEENYSHGSSSASANGEETFNMNDSSSKDSN